MTFESNKTKPHFVILYLTVMVCACVSAKPRPNVVLIVCDDLNDHIVGARLFSIVDSECDGIDAQAG